MKGNWTSVIDFIIAETSLKHRWNFWSPKFQRNYLIINNVETLKGKIDFG